MLCNRHLRVLTGIAPQRSMAGQAPPVWAILLVIILGFNEFVATVQFVASPANLLMVIMGATVLCAAYVLHSLNLLGMRCGACAVSRARY